jgi:membrane fusion protein, copper/silver efflux system
MNRKKNIIALIAICLLGSGGYGLYSLGINQGKKISASTPDTNTSSGAQASSEDNSGKKILYWHDPMVPGQKFDKPGKSPFMDMQLVPVYADDNADDKGTVNISPRVQQNLGIRTAEVVKGTLSSAITTVGSVAYNERDIALVQARSNGFVERLYVKATLDPVRKGQPLAELYVPDWIATQEEYIALKRMHGSDLNSLIDGARQRMRLVGMSDEQIRQVDSSGKVHPRLTITAPIDGVVTELTVREGMTVMAGAPLARINGTNSIWINADVPENIASQLHVGNAVEAHSPSLSGAVFKGKVAAILPEVNQTTHTLKARIELSNRNHQLTPGMFVTVNFSPTNRNDVLLIPTEAIIQTGTRNVVMVAQGNGKFAPVDVETGTETNGQTEIRKGLEVGQKVVVSGQFLIDSEASLKGTATRMDGEPEIKATPPAAPVQDHSAHSAHSGEIK